MLRLALLLAFFTLPFAEPSSAQEPQDAKTQAIRDKLRALDWIYGPHDVTIGSNSVLSLPEGYVYLDAPNTTRFEELGENIGTGKEVMIAPKSLEWSAYLTFEDPGYVKDDEKIDANAILKSLTDGTERENGERKRRGWPELHVIGWSVNPAYNNVTKRLEWATLLRSQDGDVTNFFTKILGRRGFTSVLLVSSPENTAVNVVTLNGVLTGYHFTPGETYAEWRPGDKVAEYGLTGLIVGGAVAAAVKTGFWKILVAGAIAFWKLILGGIVAIAAALKSAFKRKRSNG
jgi:uncharacterized membrane-anchored protein